MMGLLYNLAIHKYNLAIRLVALFSTKAALWVKGRKGLLKKIRSSVSPYSNEKIAWFHCASLGEFEQGRPVIEAFRKKYPSYKILLSFFSPSGYEIRKNVELADWVFYLPLDTASNAAQFINLVKPDIAVFVKYEFWFNYLNELNKQSIPIYVISAIFRPSQHFFKWYGGWFRKGLKKITGIFVQNEDSEKLLKSIGMKNVWISGDTRFDRVAQLAKHPKPFPLVEKFAAGKPVFLGGSTWPPGENMIAKMYKSLEGELKLILAPHEVHQEHIRQLRDIFDQKALLYSKANPENVLNYNILIVDSIGILSHLYQYADMAYIGGGFNKAGIHNTLEAATYGKPVFFGPNYSKFQEARHLVQRKAAFCINNDADLTQTVKLLLKDRDYYNKTANEAAAYVKEKQGATRLILNTIAGELK